MSTDRPGPRGTQRTGWLLPGLVGASVIAVSAAAVAVAGLGLADLGNGPPGGGATGSGATGNGVLDQPGAGEGSFALEPTRDGDAVSAVGVIVEAPGGPPQVCATTAMPDVAYPPGAEPAPTCSPLAVPLTGLDVTAVPGWMERTGVHFTEGAVQVSGHWRAGTLEVVSITPAQPAAEDPYRDAWRVPCAAPAGGWSPREELLAATDYEAWEAANGALVTELTARPERYHGRWVGYPDGDPFAAGAPVSEMGAPAPAHEVMVVSTVDEPSVVQAELDAIFPGDLCVTQVEHSTAELAAVAERLTTGDGSWTSDADGLLSYLHNLVTVELPVLDEAAVARIGADAPLVEVRPLVVRAD